MDLVEELNKQYNNNFEYLKLLEVVYEKQSELCSIVFLYSSDIDEISQEDRDIISNFCTDKLDLNAKIVVKFRKSYLEESFIKKEIEEYFILYYSSLSGQIGENDISVSVKDKDVNVVISIKKNFIEYYDKNNINILLANYLESRFFGKFIIERREVECLDETSVNERKNQILDIISNTKVQGIKRYDVLYPVKFIGKDIEPHPEMIKNIKQERTSVILAGKIKNLQKKEYVRKNDPNKITRILYNFTLKDHTGEIQCTYFCPKTHLPKMESVVDDSTLLFEGDIKIGYNQKLVYYINYISYCTIEDGLVNEEEEKYQINLDEYQVVMPERYDYTEQQGLFYRPPIYNEYIKNNDFVVFDVETTGLNPENCDIIEIGAVKIKNGEIVEKFQTLIKPRERISDYITSINGITNEMVEDCKYGEFIIPDFYKFCEGCVLVGYNVNFDYQFIQKLAGKVGLDFKNEISDAMEIAKNKLKLGNYKLITVVKSLNLELENAHRAYNDALATAKVYLKLNEII